MTGRGLRLAAVALAVTAVACGKKGPPLPPFVRIPAAVTAMTVDRTGDDVYVTVTLPERNIDGSVPASTTRVDVWAYTGRTPPARTRWAEVGTLIGSVDLEVGEPDDPLGPPDPDAPVESRSTAAPPLPVAPKQVGVHERLTGGSLTAAPDPDAAGALTAAPVRRFYVAIAIGTKARPGPMGTVVDLELDPPPGPPGPLTAGYDAARVTLRWTEPPDRDAWVAARQAAARAAGTAVIPDAAPWRYNVYQSGNLTTAGAPAVTTPGSAAALPVAGTPRPKPVNTAPLTTPELVLPVTFDVETCFAVRAVFVADGVPVEGAPTADLCLTPIDTFPPAAPRQLAALPSGEAIDLIWEANEEPDLGGYHVLRSDAPGAPLRQLTTSPVTETRFRDASVKKGVKYFYAVVAIDNRVPDPNVSAESNRVEEEPR